MAQLSVQSDRRHRRDRHVRRGIRVVSAAVCDDHPGSRSQKDKIVRFDVTRNPTASWLARQVTEAFPWATAPRYLLRDRDASYGAEFSKRIDAMAIAEVITAPRSPWQNPYIERAIGSIRRESRLHRNLQRAPFTPRSLNVYRLLPPNAHSSLTRQGLPRLTPGHATRERTSRRRPASQRLASPLRTSRCLIGTISRSSILRPAAVPAV